MAALVDVNVLVALMHARHRHCEAAVAWLEQQDHPGSVLVCRVAQMGVLRLLTRPSVMQSDVVSGAEFWAGWSRLMGDERFAFVNEPSGLLRVWARLTADLPKGQCAETDAYLAACAVAGGWSLVTFDKGFRRFPGLRVDVLS